MSFSDESRRFMQAFVPGMNPEQTRMLLDSTFSPENRNKADTIYELLGTLDLATGQTSKEDAPYVDKCDLGALCASAKHFDTLYPQLSPAVRKHLTRLRERDEQALEALRLELDQALPNTYRDELPILITYCLVKDHNVPADEAKSLTDKYQEFAGHYV